MARRHQRTVHVVKLNRIELPLATQRDIVLEGDQTFITNMRMLKRAGELNQVTPQQFHHHTIWLIKSSLRRNHVPAGLSNRMVNA